MILQGSDTEDRAQTDLGGFGHLKLPYEPHWQTEQGKIKECVRYRLADQKCLQVDTVSSNLLAVPALFDALACFRRVITLFNKH